MRVGKSTLREIEDLKFSTRRPDSVGEEGELEDSKEELEGSEEKDVEERRPLKVDIVRLSKKRSSDRKRRGKSGNMSREKSTQPYSKCFGRYHPLQKDEINEQSAVLDAERRDKNLSSKRGQEVS